jgi:hypothetical protein
MSVEGRLGWAEEPIERVVQPGCRPMAVTAAILNPTSDGSGAGQMQRGIQDPA